MTFGNRAPKKKYTRAKIVESEHDNKIREGLIIDRIKGILECTDAGCCPAGYIKNKISGVKEIESCIKKCSEKNGYILYHGWLYNKLWNIEEIREISNDTITIIDLENNHIEIDKDLLIKLTALYERENEAIKVTWFEGLIKRGALQITEKQLWQSLERLMHSGKIYEPSIGKFAPTFK